MREVEVVFGTKALGFRLSGFRVWSFGILMETPCSAAWQVAISGQMLQKQLSSEVTAHWADTWLSKVLRNSAR